MDLPKVYVIFEEKTGLFTVASGEKPILGPGIRCYDYSPRFDEPKSEREELSDKAERLVRDWFEGGLSEPEILTEKLVDLFEIEEDDSCGFDEGDE